MESIKTWADGFGTWHASVPITGDDAHDAATAHAAIVNELTQRQGPLPVDYTRMRVVRTELTDFGTAQYKETWPGDLADDPCKHRDRERYTCGTCGLEWCGLCQPTPAARCPEEHNHPDTDVPEGITVSVLRREGAGTGILVQIDTTDEWPENERGPADLVVALNDGDLYRNADDREGGQSSLIDVQYDVRYGNWTVYARPNATDDWTHIDGGGDELSALLSIAHDIVTGG